MWNTVKYHNWCLSTNTWHLIAKAGRDILAERL